MLERRSNLLLAFALASLIALPAFPNDGPTRFLIESVVVEGLEHAKPELVLGESLLIDGREYSEGELGSAVDRIRRLPFVYEADFALRRGSERGKYQLVITVDEIRRFFFGEDLIFTHFSNALAFDDFFADSESLTPGSLAGIRLFVGKYTMLFGSVAGSSGFQAGLTRYHLFGKNAFFSLALRADGCCRVEVFPLTIDPTFSSWQNQENLRESTLTFGLPLDSHNSLRLELNHRYSENGERRNLLGQERHTALDYHDLRQNRIELSWHHDTTDDPVQPSRGRTFSAALDYRDSEAELGIQPPGFLSPQVLPIDFTPTNNRLPSYESRALRLSAQLGRHWSFGERNVVSASARIAFGRGQVENLPLLEEGAGLFEPTRLSLRQKEDLALVEAHVSARHSLALWNREKTRARGDLRLEHTLAFGFDHVSPDLEQIENPLYRKSIGTSLVFRNRWGLFRFTFQVVDYSRGF